MPARWRKLVVAVAVLAALQLGGFLLYRAVEGQRAGGGERFAFEALDREAPPLAFAGPDGRSRRLVDLRGRPVLLHFWATWCPPCVDELPDLVRAARAHDELALIAVSLDDDWDAVRRFFGGAVPAEVVRLREPGMHRRYDIIGLPDTFFVDRAGRVRARYGGARDWSGEAASEHLLQRAEGAWDSEGR